MTIKPRAKGHRTTQPKPGVAPARKSARRSLWAAWPVLLLGGLCLIFHGRILFKAANEMIAAADIGYYFLWLHEYAREHLRSGVLPRWNPFIYCGMPFAGNAQASLFYPLSWLYLVLPVVQAQRLEIALHSLLAATFMYALIRTLGLGRLAASVGAMSYAFGNYLMAHAAVGHLNQVFSMAWLPLVVLFVERGLSTRGWEWWLWAGIALGLQILAGEPQNAYYTALTVAVYGLVRSALGPAALKAWDPRRYWRWAAGTALVAIVAGLFSAAQLLPAAEYAATSDRSIASYEFSTNVSMPWSSLLEFIMPWSSTRWWGIGLGAGQPALRIQQNWEFAGYVGLLTLVLAGCSLLAGRLPALVAAWVLLPLSMILMLGRFTPLYRVAYEVLPGLDRFRIPSRAILIAQFALGIMAAFGFASLFEAGRERWKSRRWRVGALIVLVTLLGLLIAMQSLGHPHTLVAGPRGPERAAPILWSNPIVWKPLLAIAMAMGILLAMGRLSGRAAGGLVLGALALDLYLARPECVTVPHSPANDPSVVTMRKLRPEVQTDRSPYRIDTPPSVLNADAGMYAGVENVNGRTPLAQERFFRLVHAMRGAPVPRLSRHELGEPIYHRTNPFPLRLLNVKVACQWDSTSHQYRLVQDEKALPRAWLVDRVEVIADESPALDRLRAPDFDPGTTVILEKAPRMSLAPGEEPLGECRTVSGKDGDLTIECTAARSSYLVLSQMFYPGWVATVDGERVDLERADFALAALPVPPGSHRITYRYQPLSVRLGLAVTLSTSVVGAFLLYRRGRRAAASSRPQLTIQQ